MGNTLELKQTGVRLVDSAEVERIITQYTKDPNEAKFLYLKIIELRGVMATTQQMLDLKGAAELKFED